MLGQRLLCLVLSIADVELCLVLLTHCSRKKRGEKSTPFGINVKPSIILCCPGNVGIAEAEGGGMLVKCLYCVEQSHSRPMCMLSCVYAGRV